MTNWCGQYSIPRVERYGATGLQWELFESNTISLNENYTSNLNPPLSSPF